MQNIFILIIILIIILIGLLKELKIKKKLQKSICDLSNKINQINSGVFRMKNISGRIQNISFFRHSIYYELQKIKKLSFIKYVFTSNKKLNFLYKHLEDICVIFLKKQKNQKLDIIEEMLLSTYDQCIELLKIKYGKVNGDYYLDKNCEKPNLSIKRSTNDGLQIHHVKEYKVRGLSNTYLAKNNPFEYQKAENLVYCNLLEHFLLHVKICDHSKEPNHHDVGKKGALLLLNDLKDVYCRKGFKFEKYKQKIYYLKSKYFLCLRLFHSLQIYKI